MADNKNLEKKEVAKKEKKDGLGKKISKFFREYKGELKKISWPTLPEVIKNSLVTIAVVVIVGLFIWIVDSVLTLGRDAILKADGKPAVENVISDTDAVIDTETAGKIAYYGLGVTKISATDALLSGTDISATDIYVVTEKGQLVEGYIAASESEATAKLNAYAATLPAVPVSIPDAPVSPADTASNADAQ